MQTFSESSTNKLQLQQSLVLHWNRWIVQSKYLSTCAYSFLLHHNKIVADQTVGLTIVLCKTLYITRGIGLTSWARSDNILSFWTQSASIVQTFQAWQQLGHKHVYTYKIPSSCTISIFICMSCLSIS